MYKYLSNGPFDGKQFVSVKKQIWLIIEIILFLTIEGTKENSFSESFKSKIILQKVIPFRIKKEKL